MNKTERRGHNADVVKQYLSCRGEARLDRPYLFAENGSAGLYTTESGTPVVTTGRLKLLKHARWSLEAFPDWEWYNIRILPMVDPDEVWAECDGRGIINYPRYARQHYQNHFIHTFRFADGLIVEQREFMNPFNQLKALGIEVPKIDRGDIPKD